MIVVDSSVWIASLRHKDTEAVRKLKALDELDVVVVGDLVLMEVLQGATSERDAARIESRLRCFHVEAMLDPSITVKAAANFRFLRSRGITIRKTMDMIIATFCIERGYALLHQDRDFDPMALHMGLKIA